MTTSVVLKASATQRAMQETVELVAWLVVRVIMGVIMPVPSAVLLMIRQERPWHRRFIDTLAGVVLLALGVAAFTAAVYLITVSFAVWAVVTIAVYLIVGMVLAVLQAN